jgi:hypothetical protein
MKSYLQRIEADVAAFAEFRAHPWLTAAQVGILDRRIAQYRVMADELRARGW